MFKHLIGDEGVAYHVELPLHIVRYPGYPRAVVDLGEDHETALADVLLGLANSSHVPVTPTISV